MPVLPELGILFQQYLKFYNFMWRNYDIASRSELFALSGFVFYKKVKRIGVYWGVYDIHFNLHFKIVEIFFLTEWWQGKSTTYFIIYTFSFHFSLSPKYLRDTRYSTIPIGLQTM